MPGVLLDVRNGGRKAGRAKPLCRDHWVWCTDNTAGLIGYLRFIRRTKGYHIESVYDDSHGLVFASATYLDKMDTAKAREFRDAFKEKRRRDAWTDGERRIVAAMNVA